MKIEQLCTSLKNDTDDVVFKKIRHVLKNEGYIISHFYYYSLRSIKLNIGNVKLAKKIINIIQALLLRTFKGTITLTFGEVAESHVGMQQIGEMGDKGFSIKDLHNAYNYFKLNGCKTELISLNDYLPKVGIDDLTEIHQLNNTSQASVLIVRNGLKCLVGDTKGDNILTEMLMFEWDSKLYNTRRKIVQNKLARHNLNFSDTKQISDFENGKGTTVSWKEVPALTKIRSKLEGAFGDKAKNLQCEGNLYYEPKNTGIGYHGDSERKKVIGVRLGKSMVMHYMWYYNDKPRGLNVSFTLNSGDIYCMSEKAVGTDWRSKPKKQYTLRHAAGAPKYTVKTPKINIKDQRPINDSSIIVGDIWYKPSKSQINPSPTWTKMP